jgi:hypothetical protein
MKVKEIYPGLYLYLFPNQYELCSTFGRLQEFYESPIRKIRGKYFTYEQFIDAYAYLNKKIKFTYFGDWDGFNVPGNIVYNFFKKFSKDFTQKEKQLLNRLEIYNYLKKDNFYIIGVVKGNKETIKHEVAHGLFYLNKDYRKEMLKLIDEMPESMKTEAKIFLLNIKYCRAVLKDEIQAYFATGISKNMVSNWYKIIYYGYINKFKKVFENYSKEIKL